MASGNQNGQGSSSEKAQVFVSGLIQDSNPSFSVEGSWSRARNASKVTAKGDLQTLSNEPATLGCVTLSYTPIGFIHLFEDKWVILSTNNLVSEIGLFDDSECSYRIIVQDPCLDASGTPKILNCTPGQPVQTLTNNNDLKFSTFHLITGAAKLNFDCSWQIYWQDNLNPDRTLAFFIDDLGVPTPAPFYMKECCIDAGNNSPLATLYPQGCITCTPTCKIDPDKALLASLVDSPCITVSKSRSGGSLLNGSYCVTIAYTVNQQKVTDYFPVSNVQPLWTHQNLSGALDIKFTGLDTEHFDEFELVIIRNINQQTSAKRIGLYSTQTKEIFIDYINEALDTVSIEQIPIQTPVIEKSALITSVGDYLVRTEPVTKFDFNYQPLANRIHASWISVEYPSTYYRNGGNNPSYLRDEIYSFFIRFIYNTGDRSSSYHIPGRPSLPGELAPDNTSDSISPGTERHFEVVNTAFQTSTPNTPTQDGGLIIAKGDMAYWESTEFYPQKDSLVWNLSVWSAVPGWSSITGMGNPQFDLCGTPLRHHKMPDNLTPAGSATHPNACAHIDLGANSIRIIGVEFDNIHAPLDNLGQPIPGIVGYEILRGSREGNKTVIAKGMINNMRQYWTPEHPNPLTLLPNSSPFPDGLYQNYPYNCLGTDNTLSAVQTSGGYLSQATILPLPPARDDIFTFHSPDTQFKHPFLSTNELKLYGELTGIMRGSFSVSPEHPKEKLLNDLAFIVSALVGIGEAMVGMRGKRTIHRSQIRNPASTLAGYYGASVPGAIAGAAAEVISTVAVTPWYARLLAVDPGWSGGYGIVNLGGMLLGQDPYDIYMTNPATRALDFVPGATDHLQTEIIEVSGGYANPFSGILGIPLFSHYWTLGTDTTLRLFQAAIPYRDYAYRFLSEGFYNNSRSSNMSISSGNRRFGLFDLTYLENQRQVLSDKRPGSFWPNPSINNLYRNAAVTLQTQKAVDSIVAHSVTDTSYVTIQDAGYTTPTNELVRDISSFYGALIQRIKNQYGQLDAIQQIPVSCKFDINPNPVIDNSTSEIFGGDTYISRYTEKNTFFYFWDWLQGQPDGYEFDYRSRYMLTYPAFWADFTKFEAGDFLKSLLNVFNPSSIVGPSSKAALDRLASTTTLNVIFNAILSVIGLRFSIREAYFYLFQSGVRDFFVESEVNTDLRDYGDLPEERFYDPYSYTSTYDLFTPKIIKSGNFFKYDYSLSISRLFQNFISWGSLQPRSYDPFVAETCYVTRPKRLIYSLPQNTENKKDFWRVFLANNYKDFYSPVSAIKSYNQNGAVILFESDSPILWKGIDTLESDIGTKITLGDGGLFVQPPQSIVNTDVSLEYGSCQDSRSVLNTPFGLYYMCANQGKIFHITESLVDITYHGLKFWFKEYLPFWLLKDFPDFSLTDNPVTGIGCQAVYDNQIETVYFCKKDWKLLDGYSTSLTTPGSLGTVTYVSNDDFLFTDLSGTVTKIKLGDPIYFAPASWTVSYDPKAEKGGWISWHDWHPDLLVPSKNDFLSTKGTSLFRHNSRRDLFCDYYNLGPFPFELEFISSTQFTVNTLRSIEYYLECYVYPGSTLDRFHQLDQNFDHAVISNTEQVSGMLKLTLTPKNDPFGRLTYPKVSGTFIDILFSKEENKFRFNQFWDIVRDRGEFPPPLVTTPIWTTQPNGYIQDLNPLNIDYQKNDFQRKRFRQYLNKVWLQKSVSGSSNFVVKAAISKDLVSLR